MANEAPQPGDANPQQKPKLTFVLLMACGLASGVAGFAIPAVLPAIVEKSDKSAEGKSEGQGKDATAPAFIAFGDTVVNLNSDRFNRYLRVAITLQVYQRDLDQVTKELEKHKAILKSWLLSYLSDRSMEEIRGSAGQNRLRREILEQFNSVLFDDGHDRIRDVLFEEFGVQ